MIKLPNCSKEITIKCLQTQKQHTIQETTKNSNQSNYDHENHIGAINAENRRQKREYIQSKNRKYRGYRKTITGPGITNHKLRRLTGVLRVRVTGDPAIVTQTVNGSLPTCSVE